MTCLNIFRMMSCDTLEDGSMWLKAQYSIACEYDFPMSSFLFGDQFTYGYYYGLAIVLVGVFPVGVPLSLFLFLRSKREQLFEPLDPDAPIIRDSDGDIVRTPNHVTSKYLGTLYVAYSSKFYWWECLELVRKVLITGVIIFIAPGTSTQFVFGCIIALVFTVSYAEFKPYLYGEDDVLQLLCQLAIFCTMFSGLLIKAKIATDDEYNKGVFQAILIILNVVPIAVGILRISFIVSTLLKKVAGKRHVVLHLMQKGAIKRVLQTPKFPKLDDNGNEDDGTKSKIKSDSSEKKKRRWFGRKRAQPTGEAQLQKPPVGRILNAEEEQAVVRRTVEETV